jgi:hypothetical protein
MEDNVSAPEPQPDSSLTGAKSRSRVEPCEFEALLERAMEVLGRQPA